MTEQTYTYSHNDFNIDQLGNYTLLIKADDNTFDYAITRDDILMAAATGCPIEELKTNKFTADYKKTVVGLNTKAFTLVPAQLFDAARVADMARILYVKEHEKILAQVLDEDNHVIYKVSEQLINTIAAHSIKDIIFAPKGWLKAIQQNGSSESQFNINIDDRYTEFAYFKNNKLRFYNKFETINTDELVYFTLMVSKELNLDQKDVTLVLSGNINIGDDQYKKLAEYFSILKLNSQKVVEIPADAPSHQLLSLVALYLCA